MTTANGAKPAKEDFSDWLTKEQTREQLRVSLRTLDTYVQDGKLQSAKRPQLGKVPATVYHPADVEKLRQEKQPAAHVMPENEDSAQPSRSLARTAQSGQAEGFMMFLETLRAHFAQPAETPLSERLVLSIKEAARLSGWPQSYLREAIRDGKLTAVKTGRGWRIRRKDLENL